MRVQHKIALCAAIVIALSPVSLSFIPKGHRVRPQNALYQATRAEQSSFATALHSMNDGAGHEFKSVKDEVKQPKSDLEVYVYDDVFSPDVCEELHYLAIDHNVRGNDGSSIFTRPPYNDKPLTPLENAMDSALTALNDTSRTVEYWSREEFMNIDVHADIDEVQLEEDGVLRCPKVAHVLYLEVQEGLRGPTCVFPGKRLGWGLEEGEFASDEGLPVDLVVIPAVQGRILRFPGGGMHGVPRPANRWFLADKEEKALRREEKEEMYAESLEDEDEEWSGDDDGFEDDEDDFDDEDDDEIERSVLLFNTWPDDELPPRGVNGDYVTGALPGGIEIDDVDSDFSKTQEAQRLADWEEEYGVNSESIRCKPVSEWKRMRLSKGESDEQLEEGEKVRVSLMGKRSRRVHPKKNVRLVGPRSSLEKALDEQAKVTTFRLKE